jgi:hypothetical protein
LPKTPRGGYWIPDSLHQGHRLPVKISQNNKKKISHNAKIRNKIYCFLLTLGTLMRKDNTKKTLPTPWAFTLIPAGGDCPSALCGRENSPPSPGKLGYCSFIFDYLLV